MNIENNPHMAEGEVILWRGESRATSSVSFWHVCGVTVSVLIRLFIFLGAVALFYGAVSEQGAMADIETLLLSREWGLLWREHPVFPILVFSFTALAVYPLLVNLSSLVLGLFNPRKLRYVISDSRIFIGNEAGSKWIEISLSELFHIQLTEEGQGRGTIAFIGHEDLSGENISTFQRPAFISIDNVHTVMEIIRKAQKQRGLL